ncbi:hypothetical protein [Thalassoglobus polymorphus]|uniref:Uncharacterized protein n=1 Tax=Thalassoglobus polymorphus TaxID=2527994 RepID=A0A517QUT3_9PLAN|nr:hypothetical protein [Thalassoglobus polymorphus]QDT35395.1 hypothetical protein Mal48_46720 [Thalassoglobus polymorphus]
MKLNLLVTFGILTCYSMLGCTGGSDPVAPATAEKGHDDHDHHDHGEGAHDHFETFSEAVADLAAKRDAIKTAMEADDLKKADGPVHALGHTLEELEELATKQGLSEEKLTEVKAARDALFEAFAALDETIHGKADGKSWADVSAEIDAAIAQLQTLTADAPKEEEASS